MGKVTIRYEQPKQRESRTLRRWPFKVVAVGYKYPRLTLSLQGEPAENCGEVVYIGALAAYVSLLVKPNDEVRSSGTSYRR